MIDKNEAEKIVTEFLLQDWQIEGDEFVILNEDTIERNFGWVFFYDSKKYLETDNISYALAGNAPIILNKYNGSKHITGTAFETEHYINEYEANLSA